jgi:hypothetical protein
MAVIPDKEFKSDQRGFKWITEWSKKVNSRLSPVLLINSAKIDSEKKIEILERKH